MFVNIIVSSILVALFFILGNGTQAIKKILTVLTNICLKILSVFGIKINRKEKQVKVSEEFKKSYGDIRIVKLSKKNIKQKSSIDWFYLIVFLIAVVLVVVNLKWVTGNAISNWIYSWLHIMDEVSINTFYTAILFSIISFSLSKLLQRWKETKQQRVERKQALMKLKAVKLMSSKELLDEAKKKDEKKYKELK